MCLELYSTWVYFWDKKLKEKLNKITRCLLSYVWAGRPVKCLAYLICQSRPVVRFSLKLGPYLVSACVHFICEQIKWPSFLWIYFFVTKRETTLPNCSKPCLCTKISKDVRRYVTVLPNTQKDELPFVGVFW